MQEKCAPPGRMLLEIDGRLSRYECLHFRGADMYLQSMVFSPDRGKAPAWCFYPKYSCEFNHHNSRACLPDLQRIRVDIPSKMSWLLRVCRSLRSFSRCGDVELQRVVDD